MRRILICITIVAAIAGCLSRTASAQGVLAPPAGSAAATPENAVLLTIFLRHDQSRPLSELNAQLARQGFYKQFPPPGVEVISWNIVMGIGQIVTLRFPASRIREINRALEDTAWGHTAPNSTRRMTINPNPRA